MGTDIAEAVDKLPSPSDIKVHGLMCTELIQLIDGIDNILPEIEAARPRCSSGIQSLCLLNNTIHKARLLVHDCSESSKLYLALKGSAILSGCKKSKNSLEQSLSQIQNMVPVMLASKISRMIDQLRGVTFSLDPFEEEAGKAVKALLEQYKSGSCLGKDSDDENILVAARKLQITSHKALLTEQRSIKKLLSKVGDKESDQRKKQILMFLSGLLKKYSKSIMSGHFKNDDIVQNQDYRSREVDFCVDREIARDSTEPPEEFKCPISLKLMYEPVVIASGRTFERMWIQKWFDEGHDVCPKTKRKLSHMSLTPNTALKDLISRWCAAHGVVISDPCVQLSTYNAWENSSSSINSLSISMNDLQLPVDYSNISLGSLGDSHSAVDTRELDVELTQQLDHTLPWKLQCKIVEDLMTCLSRDDQACRSMLYGNLVESLVRFLKFARDVNDVKAQRDGCLLLQILVGRCRCVQYLKNDAYRLIVEFLESEVRDEALAITEALSSNQNCLLELVSAGALTCIFKILDTQIREIQIPALKILHKSILARNIRSLVVSSDLIPKLVTLFEDESLSRYCIAILADLCVNQEDRSVIVETNGCLSFLAKVLESGSCEEQEQALEILLSLCSQSIQYCRLVTNEGVIPSVFSISINGNDRGKAIAFEMLRLLTEID